MSELITWSDRYSLGIAEIDEQHKKMFNILNRLYGAMKSGREKEELKTILEELHNYADYHFATEEKHFKEFNYEHADEHITSHNAYREKIAQFTKEYDNNEVMLSFNLMDYLSGWWTGHILGEDRQYVQNFHEHGLK